MTAALVLLAVLVTAGGVAAVSAREPRFAALGMFVGLVGAPYVADPLPGVVALAARATGAVLAGYLVWISLRGGPPPTAGWRLGWPGSAAIAIVAFAVGWLAAGTVGGALASSGDGPSTGAAVALGAGSAVPRGALGAALALLALAAAPVLVGRDVLRLGLGLLLLLAAVTLLRNTFIAAPDGIVDLALAVLTAASGAAVAGLVAHSLAANADLRLRGAGKGARVHQRPTDEAHPVHRATAMPPGGGPDG